jgi:hypothetical protein
VLLARLAEHDPRVANLQLGVHDRAVLPLHLFADLRVKRPPCKFDQLLRVVDDEVGSDGVVALRNWFHSHCVLHIGAIAKRVSAPIDPVNRTRDPSVLAPGLAGNGSEAKDGGMMSFCSGGGHREA